MTTIVSHNTLWLRRFAIIFGAALVAAIAFNIYITRRLDAQAAAENRPVLSPPAQENAPPSAAPVPVAVSAAANRPPAVVEAPRPSPALPVPRPAPTLPAVAAIPASVPAGDKARPRPSTGEGKKALEHARSAFERDDFPKAVQQGRSALAQGEGGAHAILGAAYFKLGRFEDAEREYGEALRLDPKNLVLIKRVDIARRAASRGTEGTSP